MIVKILDRYLNLSIVREVTYDGEATILMFDPQHSVSVPGDYREYLRSMTGGSTVVAANAADFSP